MRPINNPVKNMKIPSPLLEAPFLAISVWSSVFQGWVTAAKMAADS